MAKKNLQSVTANLASLAAQMPTQKTAPAAVDTPPTPTRHHALDETVQISLRLRKALRKQLDRLARDADMTMRAFVLQALKQRGLDVREDDLLDLRKERG